MLDDDDLDVDDDDFDEDNDRADDDATAAAAAVWCRVGRDGMLCYCHYALGSRYHSIQFLVECVWIWTSVVAVKCCMLH